MSQRRGFTLLEIIIAGAILTSLTVIALQMMRNVSIQRRSLADRRAAIQAADNVMERLFALPWDDLTEERIAELNFVGSQSSAERDVKVAIHSVEQPMPGRRIAVRVDWRSRVVEEQLSTRITAWRFQPSTAQASPDGENQEEPDAP